jgi:transcriptional regulator with XRE-family HTH domain
MRTPRKKSLGEFLRDSRVARDRSLRDVAKHLGISPSYLSDIENDRRVPSEQVMTSLASTLQLDLDELMTLAGRLGSESERLLRTPAAATLFRKLSKLPEEDAAKALEGFNQSLGRKTRGT